MFTTLKSLLAASSACETMSRRHFLLGVGAVGAAAAMAPLLGGMGEAEAAPMTERPDLADQLDADWDAEATPVQYGGRRRWRRRQLARLCRNDRRFRRNNRRLCSRVGGRIGRPGSCVQIGPVTICE